MISAQERALARRYSQAGFLAFLPYVYEAMDNAEKAAQRKRPDKRAEALDSVAEALLLHALGRRVHTLPALIAKAGLADHPFGELHGDLVMASVLEDVREMGRQKGAAHAA